MWYVMTIINLAGGVATIYTLIETMGRYMIAPRMKYYIFLTIASMLMLCWTQIFSLTQDGNWHLKWAATFWWAKSLYLAWAVRYTSIKK